MAADRLDVDRVQVSLAMPMAFTVRAPASGKEAWQICDVELQSKLVGEQAELSVTVGTDVTSLCPCSKAISDYGAHNQRSRVRLTTVGRDEDVYPVNVATAFDMIRSVGLSPVYPLIKRPDERVVTMEAHDHPAFVEDVARGLSATAASASPAAEPTRLLDDGTQDSSVPAQESSRATIVASLKVSGLAGALH